MTLAGCLEWALQVAPPHLQVSAEKPSLSKVVSCPAKVAVSQHTVPNHLPLKSAGPSPPPLLSQSPARSEASGLLLQQGAQCRAYKSTWNRLPTEKKNWREKWDHGLKLWIMSGFSFLAEAQRCFSLAFSWNSCVHFTWDCVSDSQSPLVGPICRCVPLDPLSTLSISCRKLKGTAWIEPWWVTTLS